MEQYSFIYNGIRYSTGTIIKIKKYDLILHTEVEQIAIFSHITNNNRYVINVDDKMCIYTSDMFYKILIDVTNSTDKKYLAKYQSNFQNQEKKRKLTFKNELNIDGLLIAWMWYIFIMAIATIFNDRIVIWILASIIFFNFRNKKLRKAGYK